MASKKGTEKLTTSAKAAAVIVAMGSDYAADVYKHMHEDEVERISLEVAKLGQVPPAEMQAIMEDFYGLCVTQKVIAEGGVLYARDILEKAFGRSLRSPIWTGFPNLCRPARLSSSAKPIIKTCS